MGWDHPQIGRWTSADLVHWSGGMVIVVPPEAECAWAPEFSYLAAEKKFHVYWSFIWHAHRVIFYTTTRDWSDHASARSAVYYDLGVNDVDLTVREHAETYHAFHKPGTVEDMLGNRVLTSHSMNPRWQALPRETIPAGTCCRINPNLPKHRRRSGSSAKIAGTCTATRSTIRWKRGNHRFCHVQKDRGPSTAARQTLQHDPDHRGRT